jgi:hypothetical protein
MNDHNIARHSVRVAMPTTLAELERACRAARRLGFSDTAVVTGPNFFDSGLQVTEPATDAADDE